MDSAQAKLFSESLTGTMVGDWLIEGSLGNGKSAVVMRGTNGTITAAVKIFHRELIERYGKDVQLGRIKRELLLVGEHHPNLVKILDGGECPVSGNLYVVMEALNQANLHDSKSNIDPSQIWPIVSQVAEAAKFLESKGLVHRDIKPENIAISNDFSHATLLDLGVLRPVGIGDLTDINQRPFIGTLRYSSPEFLKREEEDTFDHWRALTFYQIGAVLHDLLMKHELFKDYTEPYPRLVEAVLHIKPEVTGDDHTLVKLCNHCLTKYFKTRLELVKWEDFYPPNPDKDNVSLRDDIRKRQTYFRELSKPTVAANEALRLLGIRLDSVTEKVSNRVDEIVRELQYFPIKKSYSNISLEKKSGWVSFHFQKDPSIGLTKLLTLTFLIELIDEQEYVYRMKYAATLSREEINSPEKLTFQMVCSGNDSELVNFDLLEKILLTTLETAYSRLDVSTAASADDITILTT